MSPLPPISSLWHGRGEEDRGVDERKDLLAPAVARLVPLCDKRSCRDKRSCLEKCSPHGHLNGFSFVSVGERRQSWAKASFERWDR